MAQYPLIPGYGGGDMIGSSLPDGSGIAEALARNAQLGAEQAQKPKFDIGKFLLAWAGHLGDSLTGNPVYASGQQSMQRAQAEEQELKRQKDWWYEQQRFKMEHEQPEKPGLAREVEWLQGLPDAERRVVMGMIGALRPGMQAPVILPHDAEPLGGAPEAPPITATGPNGEKIKFNPQSGAWEPMGGPTGSPPSGGFL